MQYYRRRKDNTGWIIFLCMLIPTAFGAGWFCGRTHLQYEIRETMRELGDAFKQGFPRLPPKTKPPK